MGHHQPVSSGESSESFVSDVQSHLGSLLLTFDATALVQRGCKPLYIHVLYEASIKSPSSPICEGLVISSLDLRLPNRVGKPKSWHFC